VDRAELADLLNDLLDEALEPPTPAQVMEAAAVLGWTPPGDGYLAPLR
jgi:hypothetical protein